MILLQPEVVFGPEGGKGAWGTYVPGSILGLVLRGKNTHKYTQMKQNDPLQGHPGGLMVTNLENAVCQLSSIFSL